MQDAALERLTQKGDDFIVAAGDNVLCSRALIEHAKPHIRQYWEGWLENIGFGWVGLSLEQPTAPQIGSTLPAKDPLQSAIDGLLRSGLPPDAA